MTQTSSAARNRQNGFTIIELLIVILIIGILAAIAIPNLLTGMQRSKQKRTMADARSIATAWEARATDFNRYNAAGYATLNPVTQSQLDALLTPTYVRNIPDKDGWGNRWYYGMDQAPAAATPAEEYVIVSYGRDGAANTALTQAVTTDFDCDIVYSNGAFVVYPEGVQANN